MEYELLTKIDNAPWNIFIPEELTKYIHDKMEYPIIYDRFKKRAFCPNCSKYFSYSFSTSVKELSVAKEVHLMKRFYSNDYIKCPLCGKGGRAITHTSKWGKWVDVMCGHYENDELKVTVLSGYWGYNGGFDQLDLHLGTVRVWRSIKFSREKISMIYKPYDQSNWMKTKDVGVPADTSYGYIHPSLSHSYEESFLKYSEIKINSNCMKNFRDLIRLMELHTKYPQLEYLKKVGLQDLETYMLYKQPTYLRPNWNKKTIPEILGLTAQDVTNLKSWGKFEIKEIAAYKTFKKYRKKINKEDLDVFFEIFGDIGIFKVKTNYTAHFVGMDPIKTARFLKKYYENNIPCCSHGKSGYSLSAIKREYCDYINQLRELNYPLDDYYLYNKNFMEMHQKISEELRKKKDAEEAEKRKTKEIMYKEKYLPKLETLAWEKGKYFIRPLVDYLDFSAEGKNNVNCVASYYERAMKGTTAIFVIREKTEPDKSLVTVELADGKIKQCYAIKNSTPPEDVRKFADEWLEVVVRGKVKKGAA